MSKSDTQNNEGQPSVSESTTPILQVTERPASPPLEQSDKNAPRGSTELKIPSNDQPCSSIPRRLPGALAFVLIIFWLLFAYTTFTGRSATSDSDSQVNGSAPDRSLRRYWKDAVLPRKWHRTSNPRKITRLDPDVELVKRSHMAQDSHKQALLAQITERLPNITKTLIVEDFRGTLFRLEWLSEDFMWATSVGMDGSAPPKLDLGSAESGPSYSYFAYPKNSSQQSMVAFVDSCLLLRQNNSFLHPSEAEAEEDQDQSQRIFKSARLIASSGGRLIYTDCTGELVPLSLTVEDILSQSPLKSPLFPNLVLVGSQSRDIRTLQFATGEIINSRCNEDSADAEKAHKCANTCSLPWRKGLFLDSGIQLEMAETVTQIFAINTTTHQRIWGLKLNQIAPVAIAEAASPACVVDMAQHSTLNGNSQQHRSEVKVWHPVDAGRACDAPELSKIIFDAISLEDNVLQIDICTIYEYIHSQSSEPPTGMASYWLSLCADPPSRMRLQTRHVFPSPLLQVFSLKNMGHSGGTDFWRSGRFSALAGPTSLTLTQPLVNQKVDIPFDFKDSLRSHLFSCVFEERTDADGRKEPLHQRLPVYKSPSVTVKRETIEKSLLPRRTSKEEFDPDTSRRLTLNKLRDLLADSAIKESPKAASFNGKISPEWAKANDVKLISGVLYSMPDVSQEQNRDNLLFVLSPARRSLKFQLVTLLVPSLCLVGLGWYAHGRLTARPKTSSKRNGNSQLASSKKDNSSINSDGGHSFRTIPSRIYRRGLRRKSKSNEVSANPLINSPESHRSLKALKSTMTHLMFGTGEDTDVGNYYEHSDEELTNGMPENPSHADYRWWAVRRQILNDLGRGMARNIKSVVFRKSSSDGALRKLVSEDSLESSRAISPPESLDRKIGKKSWFDVRKYMKGSSSMMQNDSTMATQREMPMRGASREGGTNMSEHSSEDSPVSTKKLPIMAVMNAPGGTINTNNNQLYDSAGTLIESNVPPDSLLSELLENGRSMRTFDHWQLIGKGGFGSVYKVRHRLEPDQTCYALKLVEFQASTDGAIKYGRNFREVSTNRDVTSKYVVRYFTWWCEEPQFLPTNNYPAPPVDIPKPVPPLWSRPVLLKKEEKAADPNDLSMLAFQSRRALDSSDDDESRNSCDWTSTNPPRNDKVISLRKAEGFSKPLRAHLAALAEEFKGRLNEGKGEPDSLAVPDLPGVPDIFPDEVHSPKDQGLTRTKRKYSHVQSCKGPELAKGLTKGVNQGKLKKVEDGSAVSDSSRRSSEDLASSFVNGYRLPNNDALCPDEVTSDSDDGITFAESSAIKSESPPKLDLLERTRRKRFTSDATKQTVQGPLAEKRKYDDDPTEPRNEVQRAAEVIRVRACKVTLVIQMEWCNGMTLRQWLEKPERDKSCLLCLDSGEERLELVFFKQIMKGIRDIHKQGIVHRDLKPENIFVQRNSIKIGDFGLSKLVERHQHCNDTDDSEIRGPGGQTSLDAMVALQRNFSLTSLAGVMIGTPSYAAPEGGVNCSEKADIYSAALILLELLSDGMKTSHERQRLLSNFRNHSSYPDYFQDGNFDGWKLLLECMSHVDPKKRPSAETILNLIKTCNYEVSSTKYQLDVAALRVKLKEHSLT